MKLTLRIGRQRPKTAETNGVQTGHDPAGRTQEPQPTRTRTAAPTLKLVPLPRTTDQRVVHVGSFCRVTDIGQTAVTETGRAVVAIASGRCGRWVYSDAA